MKLPVSAAVSSSQELLTLTHKVNWFQDDLKAYILGISFSFLFPKCVYSWLRSSLGSSGSLWWRSYAESGSTAALSSSSLSWVQASSSSQTPSWRKQTSCILRRVRPLDFPAVDGVSHVQETEHVLSKEDTQMHMQRRLTRCLNRQNSSPDTKLTETDSCLLWGPEQQPPVEAMVDTWRRWCLLSGSGLSGRVCVHSYWTDSYSEIAKKKKKSGYSWFTKLYSKNTLLWLFLWLVWRDHHIYANSGWFHLH